MRHGRDGRRLMVANKVSGEGGRREPLEPVLEEAAGERWLVKLAMEVVSGRWQSQSQRREQGGRHGRDVEEDAA